MRDDSPISGGPSRSDIVVVSIKQLPPISWKFELLDSSQRSDKRSQANHRGRPRSKSVSAEMNCFFLCSTEREKGNNRVGSSELQSNPGRVSSERERWSTMMTHLNLLRFINSSLGHTSEKRRRKNRFSLSGLESN